MNVVGNKDKGWIMVNMVMYFLLHKSPRTSFLVEELLASRQELRATDIELSNVIVYIF